jgi:RHH-type proline utilization regulon transcriptional repressor/proline dehydrogenase/delta 1-pyrroline-5-carboxylate dehydrogenase
VLDADTRRLLPQSLPPAVAAAIEENSADFELALTPDEARAAPLRRRLAARAGARVRVVTPIGGAYPLHWLVVERVVSVNTAAAGGNATLMTLEPV